jgi:hypothetical protein
VAAVFTAALLSGCAQTVLFRTDRPGAVLTVEDEDKGAIPAEGLFVAIAPGGGDVTYSLREGEEIVERGVIERELRWLPLVTAIMATAVAVPFCALTCFGLANPLVCVAPIWALLGTTAGLSAVASTPGWLSLPCAFVGTAVGLSPMGLLLFAERTPPVLRVGVTDEGRRQREQASTPPTGNAARPPTTTPPPARALAMAY